MFKNVSNLKNTIYISKLIAGYYAQTLTKEETQELNKWLESDKSHPKLLQKILNEKAIANSVKSFQRYHAEIEPGLYRLHKEIQSKAKVKHIRLKQVLKYAAILLVPLVMGAYILFMNPFNILQKEQVAVKHGIKKAQLVVSPDLVYDLETQKEIISNNTAINIENNGQKLIYKESAEFKQKTKKEETHTLIVPRGGEWDLVLSDGTKVWLNAETELRFPEQFLNKRRVVELVYGEAYFEVNHDEEHPFMVKSKEGLIEVLGTSFNIRSYLDEEENITTLVEGRVKLSPVLDPSAELVLIPGDQAVISEKDNIVKVRKVRTGYYTAWKDKRFEFNNEPLEYVMRNIARWYDVEIIYKDEETRNYRFSARLGRYDNIEALIEKIELTQKVKIEITHKGLEVSNY